MLQDLSSSKLAPMVALMADQLRTPALPWMLPQSLTLSGFRNLPRDDYESEADLKTWRIKCYIGQSCMRLEAPEKNCSKWILTLTWHGSIPDHGRGWTWVPLGRCGATTALPIFWALGQHGWSRGQQEGSCSCGGPNRLGTYHDLSRFWRSLVFNHPTLGLWASLLFVCKTMFLGCMIAEETFWQVNTIQFWGQQFWTQTHTWLWIKLMPPCSHQRR